LKPITPFVSFIVCAAIDTVVSALIVSQLDTRGYHKVQGGSQIDNRGSCLLIGIYRAIHRSCADRDFFTESTPAGPFVVYSFNIYTTKKRDIFP